MDFFDQKYNNAGASDGFDEGFSDVFFSEEDFGSVVPESIGHQRREFSRFGVSPEPINLSGDAASQ